jgi:muramoyltetrapeptide carboxypeptidase
MSQLPHLLKPGNRVGIISPASHPTSDQWKAGLQVLSDWGLEIVLGDHYLAEHFGLGGTDEQRRADLQQMLDDPSIAAIFPLRGGYGVSRLLDGLDFTKFRNNPKWVVGFSDITALLCHIDTFSIASIHGPMPNNFCQKGGEAALANLHTLLFEGRTHMHTTSHALNKHGVAEASIIGGNLSLLTHLIGSNSFPNPKGKILFIEEVGERLYHVDRLLLQLKRAGYLADLAGLIIGGFTDCKEASLTIGLSVEDMILEHTAAYHYPIAFDFPAGHIPNNQAIPMGKKIKFLVNAEIVQVTD